MAVLCLRSEGVPTVPMAHSLAAITGFFFNCPGAQAGLPRPVGMLGSLPGQCDGGEATTSRADYLKSTKGRISIFWNKGVLHHLSASGCPAPHREDLRGIQVHLTDYIVAWLPEPGAQTKAAGAQRSFLPAAAPPGCTHSMRPLPAPRSPAAREDLTGAKTNKGRF